MNKASHESLVRDAAWRKRKYGTVLEVDAETSLRLASIRQKGTTPELIVRQILRRMGHRYRLSNRNLPGSPDIANRAKRWAVFVHGCFWHHHEGCSKATIPKRNRKFWIAKFEANKARDARASEQLRGLGFRVVELWECQIRDPNATLRLLTRSLPTPS